MGDFLGGFLTSAVVLVVGIVVSVALAAASGWLVGKWIVKREGWGWATSVVVLVASICMIPFATAQVEAGQARAEMDQQLTFPAVYQVYGGPRDVPAFTLYADGRAEVKALSLGDSEHTDGTGRHCFTGSSAVTDTDAHWAMVERGVLKIEVGAVSTRVAYDDAFFLADGWGKVYAMTSCASPYAETFSPAGSERVSG
jgi:hypothetical protein